MLALYIVPSMILNGAIHMYYAIKTIPGICSVIVLGFKNFLWSGENVWIWSTIESAPWNFSCTQVWENTIKLNCWKTAEGWRMGFAHKILLPLRLWSCFPKSMITFRLRPWSVVLGTGFLILVLENSINEAIPKGWWSNHKFNHCEKCFSEPNSLFTE